MLLAAAALLPGSAAAQTSHVSGGYFPGGSVSGVILDSEGIPQMGALVQLLLPDTTPAAVALTDSNGRYRVSDLKPGRYRVRVSAALFLPAVRQTLQVSANTRAVVNLTLSTLLAPTQWLPATRRSGDAAEDDWMWTLRSSTVRPVLRIHDDGTATLGVSSSSQERHRVQSQGRIAIYANDGGFAHGGNHEVFTMERSSADGTGAVLRADFSGPRVPFPVAPSAEISAGFGRQLPLGASTRTVVSYLSHPELLNQQGSNGMQAMVVRNAQRIDLGDTFRVDAGSTLRAFNLAGNTIAAEPFFRLAYRAGSGVVVGYSYTASRGTSQMEDLDRVAPPTPLAIKRDGRLRLSGGSAHAVSVGVHTPRGGKLQAEVYHENIVSPLLAGVGTVSSADGVSMPLLSDPTTQTYFIAGRDFSGAGVRFSLDQPVTNHLAVSASVASGSALVNDSPAPASIASAASQAGVHQALSADVRARANFARTGTRAEAGYRWQRASTLTAVDSFRANTDPAYLSLLLRQRLERLPLLPSGLEVVVQVQNLLAQGYQPYLSSDGHTLYLAQSPRMLQAGLAFTF
ncbi:hypothetical protein GCM10022270_26050 [Terriglobus aquaticus]